MTATEEGGKVMLSTHKVMPNGILEHTMTMDNKFERESVFIVNNLHEMRVNKAFCHQEMNSHEK